ncbi:MAG: extracellular solute-binding protein [Clostridia bacterium]|nr:extracellular solute-binding protein [Clostridia bacterium]
MKKLTALLLALIMLMSVSTVFADDERVLNICTPNSDGLRSIYALFEQETGIKVNSESLGTGDCMKRIDAEKEQEYCSFDLMYGGSLANFVANKDLFQDYYSPEDEFLMEAYQNKLGFCTNYTVDGSVLLVNDDLLKEMGIEVKGYADLLQPELKGKIVSADPSASSSAFCQLTNWLLVMGEGETAAERYESDAAWKYTEDLLKGQDVKITSSSSAVYKGVINGEYAVGLTYEDPCVTMIKDGATNVHIVYPVEGTVFLPAQIGIPKNCKNIDEAQAFVDFMLSEVAQKFLAEQTTSRNIRPVEYTNDVMTPLADIVLAYEDSDYVIAHTAELKTRVLDIMNK